MALFPLCNFWNLWIKVVAFFDHRSLQSAFPSPLPIIFYVDVIHSCKSRQIKRDTRVSKGHLTTVAMEHPSSWSSSNQVSVYGRCGRLIPLPLDTNRPLSSSSSSSSSLEYLATGVTLMIETASAAAMAVVERNSFHVQISKTKENS